MKNIIEWIGKENARLIVAVVFLAGVQWQSNAADHEAIKLLTVQVNALNLRMAVVLHALELQVETDSVGTSEKNALQSPTQSAEDVTHGSQATPCGAAGDRPSGSDQVLGVDYDPTHAGRPRAIAPVITSDQAKRIGPSTANDSLTRSRSQGGVAVRLQGVGLEATPISWLKSLTTQSLGGYVTDVDTRSGRCGLFNIIDIIGRHNRAVC